MPHMKTIPFGHLTFTADPSHQTQLSELENGLNYELHIMREVERLAPTMTGFLDIGANAGIHSLNVKRLNPDIPVLAFEPTLHNHEQLQANILANNLTDFTVVPCAVSDKPGLIYANSDPDNTCCLSRLILGYEKPVFAVTLDHFNLHQFNVAKLDIEGMEWKALRGASRFMAQKPTLIMEFCPFNIRLHDDDPEERLGWLIDQGYSITVLDHIPGTRQEDCTPSQVMQHRTIVEGNITDILATPPTLYNSTYA